jgi:holo-[acyl-carrier protein] synthase
MSIVGHGIDIVETQRIARLLSEHGQQFLDRVYTPLEQQYAQSSPKRQVERLAGRFAAKEAVLKALGTGWRGGIAWTDIEVLPDMAGRPLVQLSGQCAVVAKELGITAWQISISHIESHATASAIASRE